MNYRKELYKNKYRIESTRMVGYDYSRNGYYFITICTINRECFFGNVVGGKMKLSDVGLAADQCWREIPAHFPYVVLDEYMIMPNHVHGLLRINRKIDNVFVAPKTVIAGTDAVASVETQNFASLPQRHVRQSPHVGQSTDAPQKPPETQYIASLPQRYERRLPYAGQSPNVPSKPLLQTTQRNYKNKFGPQSGNLSSIIRGYKIGVTNFANMYNQGFAWQPRFYDCIVWDEIKSLDKIREYIRRNPEKWERDRNKREGLFM